MKKFLTALLLAFFLTTSMGVVSIFAEEVTGIEQNNDNCGDNCPTSTNETGTTGTATGTGKIEPDAGASISDTCVVNPLNGVIGDDLLGSKEMKEGCLQAGIKETYTYKKFIPYFIRILFTIATGIAVLMLVYYGIMFLTRGDEEDARSSAAKGIAYTLLGLLVMILSRAIVSIIQALPLG